MTNLRYFNISLSKAGQYRKSVEMEYYLHRLILGNLEKWRSDNILSNGRLELIQQRQNELC